MNDTSNPAAFVRCAVIFQIYLGNGNPLNLRNHSSVWGR